MSTKKQGQQTSIFCSQLEFLLPHNLKIATKKGGHPNLHFLFTARFLLAQKHIRKSKGDKPLQLYFIS